VSLYQPHARTRKSALPYFQFNHQRRILFTVRIAETRNMKTAEFQSLIRKYLLPELPGYANTGSLLWKEPIEHLLRGYYFDSSEWDQSRFRITAFIQPLYVSYDSIVYLFSQELGFLSVKRELWWTWEERIIEKSVQDILRHLKRSGEPFVNSLTTPADVSSKGYQAIHLTDNNDPHLIRAIAYSWIMAGQPEQARREIGRLEAIVQGINQPPPWLCHMRDEVTDVKVLLEENPERAIAQLLEFRNVTLAQLRLTRFAKQL